MAKYLSLMLSKNISKTPEGYLICENVPICRSGFQEYLGSELVGFQGYEDSWNLEPHSRYKVFRPKDSVLDPEFISSLEGKTVVDEHPDGSVVHVDNDGELNCGHVEKVGKGEELPDGEVTLKGDLHIKDPTLIEKVWPEDDPNGPNAVRDVSLGYSLKLKRLDGGSIVMYDLRGNHVAVVEKGRAGKLIAIQDSAIKEPVQPEIKSRKETPMSLMDRIFGLGLKAFANDATPEELAAATKEMGPQPASPSKTEEHHQEDPHAEVSSAVKAYCEGGGDKEALLSFLKGEHHAATDESLEELEEETGNSGEGDGKEGKEEQHEKTDAEEKEELATDANEVDQQGQSVLKQINDSMRNLVKSNRPLVAAIIAKPKAKRTNDEQVMVDSYNSTVKSLNSSKGQVYKALSVPSKVEKVITDSKVESMETSCACFDGVPYRVGLKKHEAHLAQKGTK